MWIVTTCIKSTQLEGRVVNPATPLRYAPLVGQSTTGETDEYLFHDTHLDL